MSSRPESCPGDSIQRSRHRAARSSADLVVEAAGTGRGGMYFVTSRASRNVLAYVWRYSLESENARQVEGADQPIK